MPFSVTTLSSPAWHRKRRAKRSKVRHLLRLGLPTSRQQRVLLPQRRRRRDLASKQPPRRRVLPRLPMSLWKRSCKPSVNTCTRDSLRRNLSFPLTVVCRLGHPSPRQWDPRGPVTMPDTGHMVADLQSALNFARSQNRSPSPEAAQLLHCCSGTVDRVRGPGKEQLPDRAKTLSGRLGTHRARGLRFYKGKPSSLSVEQQGHRSNVLLRG